MARRLSRLGILTSHPIQYQAPLFRALAAELDVHVYFAHRATARDQAAAGFGVEFDWDVDLTSGYAHSFLENRARVPGIDRFLGCDTPEIARCIEQGGYDAFLVTGWHLKSYWQAVRACRRARVPVMVRGDSHLHTPRSLFKRIAKEVLTRMILRQFDAYLVVGSRAREYLLHYGARPERCFDAPHFVDNDWFGDKSLAARAGRGALRATWGAAGNTTVLMFVGKLLPIKRPLDMVYACHMLQKAGIAVTAVFVGAGVLESEIRREADRLKVQVALAGFHNQSRMPECYAAADLLVLPSESETWGLAVNEAMACGLPAVVADAVGCAPDLIEEGSTGATYPTGDPELLAAAVRRVLPLLTQPGTQDALRQKLRRHSVTAAVRGVRAAIEAVARQP